MGLFDASLRLKGFDINKAKNLLSEIHKKTEAEFEVFVKNRKQNIITHHLKQNKFYKSIGGNINLEDWNSVPVITKKDLQQPFHLLLSEPFNKKDVYINKTSGSSGDPFVFAKDKFCHALTWAIIINRFSWYGIDFNTSKQARFYGIPLDKKGYYKERLKDVFANRYRFSIFDLTDSAFEKYLAKFKTTKFEYINGYTSAIVQFAKYLKGENIVLKQVCPSLKVCMTTSEMLFESDKAIMEKQFGIPVVNEYGASELDLIAFENPKGGWQINSETLFVEILDSTNNPVPNGQEGRVVITSLYNKAFPFIRYDIGDIGALSVKSTLQNPFLEKLIGRTNDIAVLPSGKKAAGLTFYYITKSIIEEDGNVKEFIIEQLQLDYFKISYVSRQELTEAEKEVISNAMITYLEPNIIIAFERFEVLKRSTSGKLKQFVSHLKFQ
ncbi:MAG: phenylacetate--CoA ligase family protein [Winogradskyella sp.]|uniref:phenylacetate--CoA ligase family protein n=1 Tax=Winogradskyella sp. TaxID=1883156 RepID=UPI000F40E0D7|nr:phenylacetate--CoA ligase family protein [Winogradskyella sp.]RNC88190.1 MAG: phenylacetate--CoA ligase family protein [Winogradskyella sp.]